MRHAILLGALLVSAPAMAQMAAPPDQQPPGDSATPAPAPPEAAIEAPGQNWTSVVNTDFRYYSFTGNRGFPAPVNGAAPAFGRGSGTQIYLPMAGQLVGFPNPDVKIEATARGGYVTSQQNTLGLRGGYSGTTDTIISTTATYMSIPGFQPYFSLNTNAPTGQSVLFGRAANARMDPDLVDLATFGQGFNIGPAVGANIPVNENLTFSVGAGYTSLGAFRREGPINPVTGGQTTIKVDPGDSASFNASIGYQEGTFSAFLSPVYTISTSTRISRIKTFRTGDSIGLNGNVGYGWMPDWSSVLSGTYTHTENNFVANPPLNGLPEQFPNSNSDLYRLGFDTTYKYSDNLNLGPIFSVMYRDRNAFIPQTALFIPGKFRWATGAALNFSMSQSISLNARVEHLWTHEEPHPNQVIAGILFPGTGTSTLSNSGWAVSGGLTVRF